MPRTAALVLLAAFLLSVPLGCGRGDSPEALFEEMISNMNEMADLFGSINDQASANAAAARLESDILPRAERWNERMERAKASIGEEAMEEVAKQFDERIERAGERLMNQMMRTMMDPQLATSALQEAMIKFEEAGARMGM